MRVSHFLGSMLPEQDGVSRVAYRMRKILQEKSGTYDFISPILPPEPDADMRPVSSIPFPLYRDYRLSVCSTRTIRKLLQEIQPDAIHIHSPCTLGRAAVHAAQSLGIPAIATYHTHFPTYCKYYKVKFLAPVIWRYLRSLYNRCDGVIVPSKTTIDDLSSHGIKNLVHIPHGVDTGLFSPDHWSREWRESVGVKRRHPGKSGRSRAAKEKKIVTFVGRLVWEKNLKLLAEAAKLVATRDNIQFVIVGDGPARHKFQQMMPNAYFTGFLGEKDLPVAYASSDIFVFPSLTETFGNVTVEAMASGLPVICASAGGARDLVKDGVNGFLTHAHDPRDLAQAIDQLVLKADLRKKMGQAALEMADQFKWENSIGKYHKLYSKLIRNRSRKVDSQEMLRLAFDLR